MVVAHGERVREGLALRFRFRHVSVIWVAVYSFGRIAAVTISCQVSWNASGADSSAKRKRGEDLGLAITSSTS